MADWRAQAKATQAKLEEVRTAGEEARGALSAKAEQLRNAFVHSLNYFKS